MAGVHPCVDGEEPDSPRLPALKWLLSPATWIRVAPSASGGPYVVGLRQLSAHHLAGVLAAVSLEKPGGADIIAAPHPPACLVAAGTSTRSAPAKCGGLHAASLPPPAVHRHTVVSTAAVDEERRGGRVLATLPPLAAPRLGALTAHLPLHSGARRLLHSAAAAGFVVARGGDGRRWASTEVLGHHELEEVKNRLTKVEVRTLALERMSRNARRRKVGGWVLCVVVGGYGGRLYKQNEESIKQAVAKEVVDALLKEMKRRRPTVSDASAQMNAWTGGWIGSSKEQQVEMARKKLHDEREEHKRWTVYLHSCPKEQSLWVSTIKYKFTKQADVSDEEWSRFEEELKKDGGQGGK